MSNQEFNASFKTDFAELKKVCAEADQFLQRQKLSPDPVFRIELALEEMVSNVIKYGYDDQEEHDVSIRLEVSDVAVMLMIEDHGHEFNPMLAEKPSLDENISERPVGGVGIHLTRSMAGHMEYQRSGNCNILTVKVNLG